MPYTWSGGGGPPGNRYFLSIYPVLLCLAPPLRSVVPAAVAWAGGTLFTAHVLINPFIAAKQPYLISERGLLRALPVELTMVDDLPVALDARRHRLNYNTEPALLLSLLDHNVHASATLDFWIVGRTRADIVVRSPTRLSSVTATLRSRVPNRVTIGLGGDEATIDLRPDVTAEVSLAPSGVYARRRLGLPPVGSSTYRIHAQTRGPGVSRQSVPRRTGEADPPRGDCRPSGFRSAVATRHRSENRRRTRGARSRRRSARRRDHRLRAQTSRCRPAGIASPG